MSIQLILLLIAFVTANLPWLSEKIFYFVTLKSGRKNLAYCLIELLILYLVLALLFVYAELNVYGQLTKQGWEFYTVTFSLFLVFAFPGFIYKLLWSKK